MAFSSYCPYATLKVSTFTLMITLYALILSAMIISLFLWPGYFLFPHPMVQVFRWDL